MRLFLVKKNRDITVLLFGDDYNWNRNLTKQFSNSTLDVHVAQPLVNITPIVDIAFCSSYCDAVLITASASTFGWWMAYLTRPNTSIYYNSVFSKTNGIERELNPRDFFPPHWKSLNMTESPNGTVFINIQ
ncbi:unnamed protein product [Anisakis simplex]|uniref:L-Fucosyltransferase n=1 Tax=Anisakis simplex TaxID=6269 RepID=A0A3P6N582_ANISI|nr:unnamed protein product [Anisakis simplex]